MTVMVNDKNIVQCRLASLYDRVRSAPSDIVEHIEILAKLASLCDHVTEFGVRTGRSTIELIYGRSKRVVSYDIEPFPLEVELRQCAGSIGIRFEFIQQDVHKAQFKRDQ